MIFWNPTDMVFHVPNSFEGIGIGPDGQLQGRNRLQLINNSDFLVTTSQRVPTSVAKGRYTAKAVPEPLTILGSVTALVFGGLLKKQNSSKRNKQEIA